MKDTVSLQMSTLHFVSSVGVNLNVDTLKCNFN